MSTIIELNPQDFARTQQGSCLMTNTNTETGIKEPIALFDGRASGRTSVNRDGLIYDVLPYEPAFTLVDGQMVLSEEPLGENLFLYSEDFTGSGWSNQRGVITKDSSNPMIQVNKNCTKWQMTTEVGVKYLRVGGTRTGDHSFSVYVKKGSYRYLGLLNTNSAKTVIDFDTGTIVLGQAYSELEELDNGWFRLKSMFNWTGSFSYTGIYFTDETGADLTVATGNEFFYIDASQLSPSDDMSSYIVTNGATATRLAAVGVETPDISKYINSDSFTIEFTAKFSDVNDYISLGDGTSQNKIHVFAQNTTNFVANYYSNNINNNESKTSVSNTLEEHSFRMEFSDNVVTLFVDGVNSSTTIFDTEPRNFLFSHLLFNTGNLGSSGGAFTGYVKSIKITS